MSFKDKLNSEDYKWYTEEPWYVEWGLPLILAAMFIIFFATCLITSCD